METDYTKYKHVLSDQEQSVMRHYYGHSTPKLKPAAIAEVLRTPGVDSTNIRRIVAGALAKIRRERDA